MTEKIYADAQCPLCNAGKLEHRAHNGTYAYVCEECPFVGFEYYSEKNYTDLRAMIKD
jgi:rubrerythrin